MKPYSTTVIFSVSGPGSRSRFVPSVLALVIFVVRTAGTAGDQVSTVWAKVVSSGTSAADQTQYPNCVLTVFFNPVEMLAKPFHRGTAGRGSTMKYMLLIHTDTARWRTLTQVEKEDWLAEYITFTQKIIDTGEHRYGAPLADRAKSHTVRVRNGKVDITEGPLTNTEKYLAGYYVVDCENTERALEIAAEIPDARTNVVEVRPVAAMGGLET
jgi:hypothetical protein